VRWRGAAPLLAVALLVVGCSGPTTAAAASPETGGPLPVLAYYYIWFDHSSWDRAKVDLPLLGRYSSDDGNVIRQHIRWAKQAGLTGFIVSWKNTPALSRRLAQLAEIARAEDFKLAIIYQGLNFERRPLPVDVIAADLDVFADQFAAGGGGGGDGVFSLFERPLVIWSGTWEFSRDDITKITTQRRQRLLILASERNVAGYQRVADVVDGNAYYWSSVNPETFRGYDAKLASLGRAVHDRGGLWIAPAAPGFDGRLIGGTQIVERKAGQTLRRQMDAAVKSSPDAIGVISWNEFSENTHVEPSATFGRSYLDVLRDVLGAAPPTIPDFDSSEPGDADPTQLGYGLPVIGAFVALTVLAQLMIVRRSRQPKPAQNTPDRAPTRDPAQWRP
jgi:hypothetical protein